jgi:serine/threonine protein phosphatase PrpC
MSPEQLRGEPVTEASDMYAFGILAYEVLAGRGPYEAKGEAQMMAAHLQREPLKLRELRGDVDPAVAARVERCLAKDPNLRPRAQEIAAALAAAPTPAAATVPADDLGPIAQLLEELRRRRVYKVLVGYGAFVLAVFGVAQGIDQAFPMSPLVNQIMVVATLAGFPLALVLSWVFDIRAGRIERTRAIPAVTAGTHARVARPRRQRTRRGGARLAAPARRLTAMPGLDKADNPAARKPRNDELDVFGLTHPGLVRADNQDQFLTAILGRELTVLQTSLAAVPELPVIPGLPVQERAAFLAVVADGVGGSTHGAEASRLAVEAVTSCIARSLHAFSRLDPDDDTSFRKELEEAARQSHEEILHRASDDSAHAGMATTLTLWIGMWPRAWLLQVGDSRYYLLRGDELTQVSRDQTVAQELIDSGALEPTVALRTPWANVLSSALGGPTSAPSVTHISNDWNNVHLLCSDGLTRHVPDERIRERLLAMTSARQVCEELLQDALGGGGRDNITIVVGRALPAEPPANG